MNAGRGKSDGLALCSHDREGENLCFSALANRGCTPCRRRGSMILCKRQEAKQRAGGCKEHRMDQLGTAELYTDRLVLRRFREADAENVCSSYLNDEGFLYYANKEAMSVEQERASIREIEKRYSSMDYYNWLITLKDGTIIGAIHLKPDDPGESLEFHYAIDDRHRNSGYMTEALNAVKEFAVTRLNAKRFFGGCEVHNSASKRVMEKCGLQYEETLKGCLKLKDGCHDMMVYSYIDRRDAPSRSACFGI